MKILLIKGQSQYDALRIFLDDAHRAFEALGHEVVVLDLLDRITAITFEQTVREEGPFDFAFSYLILGEWRSSDGKTLGELIGGPHVIQYVDHPFTHMERLKVTSRDTVILTIDRSHGDILRLVYGDDYFAHVGFNPHAAIGPAVGIPQDIDPYAQSRPIPFFFTGSYYRPRDKPWAQLPKNIQVIFDDAAEESLSHDWIAPHEALAQAFERRGLSRHDENGKALMPFAFMVHEWVRATRRFEFLKTASKIRLPMVVCGGGYEKDLYRYKNIDYRGSMDFRDSLDLMAQSRILLNVNVNFGQGSHERPLCAMMAGTPCATEPSTFYQDAFTQDDLIYFRWSSLEQDLERIRALSTDIESLHRIAVSAQKKAVADHTWHSRAQTVIDAVHNARRP